MFEARHIRKMIRLANPTTRAMIFLGINCGFGNIDCHTLMAEEISGGWHSKPRPKTGAARRCNLWASTLHAISQVSSKKSGVVFLAPRGTRLNSGHCDTTVHNFKRFLIRIGLYRKSVTFYTLRRTFRTIADEVLDGPAVDLIMGHIDPSMGAVYRQRIAATRIEAVTDHVAEWLLRYPNASKIVWPISADEVARRNEARALRVHRKRS
jgi:integrase